MYNFTIKQSPEKFKVLNAYFYWSISLVRSETTKNQTSFYHCPVEKLNYTLSVFYMHLVLILTESMVFISKSYFQ